MSVTRHDEEDVAGRWRSLVRGFAILVAGEGAARVLGLVTILILARVLGPSGFGVVAVGTAMVTWYGLMADNATQVSSTPVIARRPEAFRVIVGPVLGLRIAVASIGMVVAIGAALTFARSPLNAEVYALFTLAFLASAPNMRWMVLAVRGSRELATANAFGQLVVLILVAAFVRTDDDILRVPLAYVAGEAAFALAVAVLIARRFGLILPRIDLVAWRETARRGLPLLVGAASRGVLLSFDLLAIAVLLGPAEAGYYGAAVKPVLLASTIVGLFSLSFLASYSASDAHARGLFRRALVGAVVLSTLAAVGIGVVAGVFVDLVFGTAFGPAAAVLAILAWRIPTMALAGVYGAALVSAGREKSVMRANLAGAAVNVPGVLLAVELWGIDAAAVVSVASSAVIAVVAHHAAVAHGSAPRLRNLVARSRRRPSAP